MENVWYIKLHRQIMDSWIWEKPTEWFKLWTYILMTVNFTENWVPVWSKHLKYEWIKIWCPGITDNQIDSFIRWAKSAWMLTTQKTTRWMILSVANYSQYQWQEKEVKPTQKPTVDRNTTETQPTLYNKNERMKEWKNINNISKDIWEQALVVEKKEYWDPIINSIIQIIKDKNNWIIDWTIASNRKYWKMLRDKIEKIKWFRWDYPGFIWTLIDRTDQYNIWKTTSCESIYYNLASLVAKIKTTHIETKEKEEELKPKTWRLQPTTSLTTT